MKRCHAVLLVFLAARGLAFEGRQKTNDCSEHSLPEEQVRLISEASQRLSVLLDANLGYELKELVEAMNRLAATEAIPFTRPPSGPSLEHKLEGIHGGIQEIKMLLSLTIQELNNKVDYVTHLEDLLQQHIERNHMEATKLLHEVKTFQQTALLQLKKPLDCSDLLAAGFTESGIYEIYPYRARSGELVEVFCDMDTDGGGWTVFLLRNDTLEKINFAADWESYKNGFGDPRQEYWLGNDRLYALTSNHDYEMMLEAKDKDGRKIWAEWNTFTVDSDENKYKLVLEEYNVEGTAPDGLGRLNGMLFSTFDQDHDSRALNCAKIHKGGWWYDGAVASCGGVNPTGILGQDSDQGIRFHEWSKEDRAEGFASWLQLKIRPTD